MTDGRELSKEGVRPRRGGGAGLLCDVLAAVVVDGEKK